MSTNNDRDLSKKRLVDAWEVIQQHSDAGMDLHPDSYRLAFADPEFLLRRETRGIRLHLELLKPELAQQHRQIDHTVVVYGSARVRSAEEVEALLATARQNNDEAVLQQAERLQRGARYYEDAREFGKIVARYSSGKPREQHFYVCTGGGPGIMEAANRGASEAGEPTVGLNITLPHEQSGNRYITPGLSFKFHYFALRKMHFMMRAKALVNFPGGFGTLDELFEILTLVQTGKSKTVPIVLYGSSYWQRVLHWDALVDEGMISPEDVNLFRYADTPEEAWAHIAGFYRLG
ncbi:MAG: TIGR00730 family Rossman fold protein [Brachymonas sp.]|nr:TIGR00730 family Rossman fold protein [Brachymonas sp.]